MESLFQNFNFQVARTGAVKRSGGAESVTVVASSTTSHALVVSRSLCIFREPAGARKDPREMGAPTTSRKADTDGDCVPEESKFQEHRAERVR